MDPPRGYDRRPSINEPVIIVNVAYDQDVAARYGAGVEWFIREALAIHNAEWRRHRSERFELGSVRLLNSGKERDATYLLSRYLLQTSEAPQTIHVRIVGRPVEVYSGVRGAIRIGGLALRGSDTLLVSTTKRAAPETLAYLLFHEIGHLWEAYDLPFPGGNSTFGSKFSAYSFNLDAGNAEIIEASNGPSPRSRRNRAPAVIESKLSRARELAGRAEVRKRLEDLVLHESSPKNPSYVRKKQALLASAGRDRGRIRRFLRELETTRDQRRHDAQVRKRIARHYWRANDLVAKKDYAGAEREIKALQSIYAEAADVHLLVGAVERKIRKRR